MVQETLPVVTAPDITKEEGLRLYEDMSLRALFEDKCGNVLQRKCLVCPPVQRSGSRVYWCHSGDATGVR